MNRPLPARDRLLPIRVLAVFAVGVAGLTGCGREEARGPATSGAEVRGEPIRGEPIAAAPSTSNVPASTTASSVTSPSAPPASTPQTVTVTATATASVTVAVANAASPGSAVKIGSGASVNDPMVVGFDKLSAFQYTLPDGPVDTNTVAQTQAAAQIPTPIKALNNQFVTLKGFMLPLKVEKGLVTELLIMRDQSMCCYGNVPRINEWVSVKMVGPGVKPIMDQAVTLLGKLKVGEMYENGYLVGIYAMDGERMAGPLDL